MLLYIFRYFYASFLNTIKIFRRLTIWLFTIKILILHLSPIKPIYLFGALHSLAFRRYSSSVIKWSISCFNLVFFFSSIKVNSIHPSELDYIRLMQSTSWPVGASALTGGSMKKLRRRCVYTEVIQSCKRLRLSSILLSPLSP